MRISINQACALTGKHRSTVTRVTNEMQSVRGRKNALLYDSKEMLQRLYVGADGAPTASEALRLLTIARTEQVRLQNEITRGKYYERAAVHFLYEHVFRIMAATLKGNVNRVLSHDVVNEIFEEFRNSADDLQARGDKLWKEFEKEIETKEGANGSRVTPGIPKSDRSRDAQSLPASSDSGSVSGKLPERDAHPWVANSS